MCVCVCVCVRVCVILGLYHDEQHTTTARSAGENVRSDGRRIGNRLVFDRRPALFEVAFAVNNRRRTHVFNLPAI